MILETLAIGSVVVGSVTAAAGVLARRREQVVHRQLQNIEFDRLMRSQAIHQTVAQARRAMVDEARRTR